MKKIIISLVVLIITIFGINSVFAFEEVKQECKIIKKSLGYDYISNFLISGNGKHFVFKGIKGKGTYLVIDGKEKKLDNNFTNIVISNSGKKVAYIVKKDNLNYVVENFVKGKEYIKKVNGIHDLQYSAFSEDLFYIAEVNGLESSVIVKNKKEIKKFKNGYGLKVGIYGKKYSFRLLGKNILFLFNSGKEVIKLDVLGFFGYTPTTNKFIYSIFKSGKEFFYIDGKELSKEKIKIIDFNEFKDFGNLYNIKKINEKDFIFEDYCGYISEYNYKKNKLIIENSKFNKYISKIEKIINSLNDKKIYILYKKLNKINIDEKKYKKIKNLILFLKSKVILEKLNRERGIQYIDAYNKN